MNFYLTLTFGMSGEGNIIGPICYAFMCPSCQSVTSQSSPLQKCTMGVFQQYTRQKCTRNQSAPPDQMVHFCHQSAPSEKTIILWAGHILYCGTHPACYYLNLNEVEIGSDLNHPSPVRQSHSVST